MYDRMFQNFFFFWGGGWSGEAVAAGWQSNVSAKFRPCFAYQWPDNVKMYELTKFDQNIIFV